MEKCKIEEIKAIEILDSRGNPSLKVCIKSCGKIACSSVPSGASTGKHEAFELRDGEKRLRGKGVRKAVQNINEIISQALVGESLTSLREIDKLLISLDGTENKSRLGGNAIVGVSMATARLISTLYEIPLYATIGGVLAKRIPTPLLNVINGGKHAGNSMSFQEFLIIPHGFSKFSDALWSSVEVYQSLREIVKQKYGAVFTSVGDEGGFAPPITDPEVALKLLSEAVSLAGYKVDSDFSFGVDAAASNFYNEKNGKYVVNGRDLSTEELTKLFLELIDSFSVKLIEDPFHEEDFESFSILTSEAKSKNAIIVGDDLLTTNISRLAIALKKKSVSAVLIKLNQIGTVSETFDFSWIAMHSGLKRVVSHRSGETEDSFIADFSVGIGSEGIKTGAPARGERTSKYNRLLEIEDELGNEAIYSGNSLFK
ncbi:MAG: phosphopyruvate hydratase [Thermoprotei archaeon]|nr:phosphopyruvate hydratase [Thermoprotei archaeon]